MKCCTLKNAWMSTSKCCWCYYSCLCTTQALVRQAGSQDWAEQVAESRPFCPPWNRHRHRRESQSSRYTPLTSQILQPAWLQTAPFHNFLKHFLSQSLSFTFFAFLPSHLSIWASPSPSFRLWSADMLAFCAIELLTAFVSSHLNNTC